MRESEVRAAKNESLFREVNERLSELRPPSSGIDCVCECAREDCTEQLRLTVQQYETVRSVPSQFALKPEHVIADVELVVRDGDGYVVVEKIGAGRAVAEHFDPRARTKLADDR